MLAVQSASIATVNRSLALLCSAGHLPIPPCGWQSGGMNTLALRAAEEDLLSSRTRRDPSRVRELLHPDFVEIGRSGRLWTRDEIVVALANEDDREAIVTDEWVFSDLAPRLVLVTYVIRGAHEDSRHSSLWCVNDGQLQMRFHQGTYVSRLQRHS